MSENPIRVFISYSWDDEEHRKWTKSLADALLREGFDAQIDQYDLEPGDRIPHFMEQSITDADFVLIICTPKYKAKAKDRNGGVGYESHLITGELYSKHNERKFIPVLRRGTINDAIPSFLAGKLAISLTESESSLQYEQDFRDLVTTLRRERKKPPVMHNAHIMHETGSTPAEVTTKDSAAYEPMRIEGIITDEVEVPTMDGSRGSALYAIPFQLSGEPSFLWQQLFIEAWNHPPRFTTMHRPGIAKVYGRKLVLDGTTIEEVKKYHRDTLVLCVEEANRKEAAILLQQEHERLAEGRRKADHAANVRSIADDIHF